MKTPWMTLVIIMAIISTESRLKAQGPGDRVALPSTAPNPNKPAQTEDEDDEQPAPKKAGDANPARPSTGGYPSADGSGGGYPGAGGGGGGYPGAAGRAGGYPGGGGYPGAGMGGGGYPGAGGMPGGGGDPGFGGVSRNRGGMPGIKGYPMDSENIDSSKAYGSVVRVKYQVSMNGAEVAENDTLGIVIAKQIMSQNGGGLQLGSGNETGTPGSPAASQYMGGMGGGMGGMQPDVLVVAVPSWIFKFDNPFKIREEVLIRKYAFFPAQISLDYYRDSSNYQLSAMTKTPTVVGDVAFVYFPFRASNYQAPLIPVSQPKFQKSREQASKLTTQFVTQTQNNNPTMGLPEGGLLLECLQTAEPGKSLDLTKTGEGGAVINKLGCEGLVIKEKFYDISEIFQLYVKAMELETKEEENSAAFRDSSQGPSDSPYGSELKPSSSSNLQESIEGLARAFRSAKSSQAKIKTGAALRAILAEEFDANQTDIENEISTLSKRLEAVKANYEERNKNRTQWIEERIKAIIDLKDQNATSNPVSDN